MKKMENNIKRIAKEAGVSIATVSRVFNKKPYVKDEIRKKVLEVARRLNYSPKLSARKVNCGIVVEWFETINLQSYESILIMTMTKHLIRNNFTFDIIPINEIDFVFKNFYDAIITIIFKPESVEKIKEINYFPVITINCPVEGFYNVYSDHKKGIEIAVDYLFSKGHRRICFFVENDTSWGARERINGFIEGLKKNNINFTKNLIQIEEKVGTFYAIKKIIENEPTALIVSGEDTIMRVLHTFNILNKRVPEDISIISFENLGLSKYLNPPHTTIDQNLEQIAEKAVEILKKIVNRESNVERNVVIENNLIERYSVKEIK